MRQGFAAGVIDRLLVDGRLSVDDRMLVICAGEHDRQLLEGFHDVTLTNLEVDETHVRAAEPGQDLGQWERQDAHQLTYDDDQFDFALVSDGLHHCRSPHRAATEMLRVARKGVIVTESRDSLVMRAAARLGLTGDYEFNRVLLSTREHGGVDYGPVPNFVYRWTEREFAKMVSSFDPEHEHRFLFFHGFNLRGGIRFARMVDAIGRVVTTLAPRQANTFAMVALRGDLRSYLRVQGHGVELRPDVAGPVRYRDKRPAHVRSS